MMNNVLEFTEGDKIIYVPSHVNGNVRHKDCEHGVVVRVNNHFVFCQFYRKENGVIWKTIQSKACLPEDLEKL